MLQDRGVATDLLYKIKVTNDRLYKVDRLKQRALNIYTLFIKYSGILLATLAAGN